MSCYNINIGTTYVGVTRFDIKEMNTMPMIKLFLSEKEYAALAAAANGRSVNEYIRAKLGLDEEAVTAAKGAAERVKPKTATDRAVDLAFNFGKNKKY